MFDKKSKQLYFAITYSIVLFLPTIFLNSSMWVQCDSIYASFVILSLLCLLRHNNIWSFICLGIALSFKFQTIFVVPFFILYYLLNDKVHFWHFLIMMFVFWLSGVPGFIFGRSLLAPFQIYLNQTKTYPSLYMGYPNFAGLFNSHSMNLYNVLSKPLIIITMLVITLGFLLFLQLPQRSSCDYLGILIWCVYSCVIFCRLCMIDMLILLTYFLLFTLLLMFHFYRFQF